MGIRNHLTCPAYGQVHLKIILFGGQGAAANIGSKEVVPMAPPGSPSLGVFPKPLLNAFQLV